MRWQIQWADEPTIFDMVSECLLSGLRGDNQYDNVNLSCRNEEDSYGDRGYIFITGPDGRRFSLQLNREDP